MPGNLGDQLRAFVLQACASLAKRRRGRYIAGNHAARGAEEFTRFQANAGLGEFPFYLGIRQADCVNRLLLTVVAD